MCNYSGHSANHSMKENLFEYTPEDTEYISQSNAFSYGLPKEAPSFRSKKVHR